MNFNKQKFSVTFANILLYISILLMFMYSFSSKSFNKTLIIALSFIFALMSFGLIALFFFLKKREYKKVDLTNRHKLFLTLFFIMEFISVIISLLSTILLISISNIIVESAIWGTAIVLIFALTITASAFETIVRMQLMFKLQNNHLNNDKIII